MNLSRRGFLEWMAVASTAVAHRGLGVAAPKMPQRTLGKMGFRASLLALGTAELGEGAETIRAIRLLLDGGVNYIDTAPSYQGTRSETVLGEALKGRRDKLFVASKTLARDADGAVAEVRESLKRLQTDRIDLLQVHAVNDQGTLDRVLAKGGAVEGLERAKREGLIGHIGITGHTRPEVILRAIRAYPFESILVPVSAVDASLNDFATEVLPEANRRGISIAGMKALKGMERATNGQFEAAELLRYAMSLPISTLTVGLRQPEQAAENLRIALEFKPMPQRERTELAHRLQSHATPDVLWWKRQ